MQRDLDRLLKRRRRIKKAAWLLVLTLVLAFVLVAVKSCGENIGTYEKEYRPVDTPLAQPVDGG